VGRFETGYHYVAKAGLELFNLLSTSPNCWDYRHAPSWPADWIFIASRAKFGVK
jgi:hypothetical protein